MGLRCSRHQRPHPQKPHVPYCGSLRQSPKCPASFGGFKCFGIAKRSRPGILTPTSLVQIQLPKPLRVLSEELLKLLNTYISFIGGFCPRFYFFYFIYLYHYNGNKYYSCHYYDGKEFNYECTYLFRSKDEGRSHER